MSTTKFKNDVEITGDLDVSGTISADIAASAGSIGTAELADSSVTSDKLASSASETVTTAAPALSIVGSTEIDSSSNAVDATLAAGTYIGQIKVIVMTDASNSSTVSIANQQTSDPEVATFDAVDETGVFMWTGTEWITLFATCTFV